MASIVFTGSPWSLVPLQIPEKQSPEPLSQGPDTRRAREKKSSFNRMAYTPREKALWIRVLNQDMHVVPRGSGLR